MSVTVSDRNRRCEDVPRYGRRVQISPRYDGPPILRVDVHLADPSVPLLRQRRRLAGILGQLDESQWTSPSRCDAWSVRDVVCHLIGTDQYWAVSIAKGLAGEPTRYLASFDPVAVPEQMVDAMRTMTSAEVLARFNEGVDGLASVLDGVDDEKWSTVAEAPPGHVTLRSVALHALWDAWIHERDIVLPLGLDPVVEDDEVAACLVYAVALGPAFLASTGSTRTGTLAIDATDPDMSLVVTCGPTVVIGEGPAPDGTPRLSGDAVALVEGLSFRSPLEHGLAAEDEWLLGGLGDVFEVNASSI
jgi:uncharacterized protein (TIGR03083 family)